MSKFKAQVQKDVHDVFLNSEEFSDIHTINGKEMAVQVDENEALDRQLRANQTVKSGVYVKQKLIYVSEAEFGSLPAIGVRIKFDGVNYIVVDAVTEDGIHSITLEKNKA
jgi:hypothetical protein